jgi:hypothetical protein
VVGDLLEIDEDECAMRRALLRQQQALIGKHTLKTEFGACGSRKLRQKYQPSRNQKMKYLRRMGDFT